MTCFRQQKSDDLRPGERAVLIENTDGYLIVPVVSSEEIVTDLRSLIAARARLRHRDGDVDDQFAELLDALHSESTAAFALALDGLREMPDDGLSFARMAEVAATVDRETADLWERAQYYTTLESFGRIDARSVHAGLENGVSELDTLEDSSFLAETDTPGKQAYRMISTALGRDPGVAKDVAFQLSRSTDVRVQWPLLRLGADEPALLQRYVANGIRTLETHEDETDAIEALMRVSRIARLFPKLVSARHIYPTLESAGDQMTEAALYCLGSVYGGPKVLFGRLQSVGIAADEPSGRFDAVVADALEATNPAVRAAGAKTLRHGHLTHPEQHHVDRLCATLRGEPNEEVQREILETLAVFFRRNPGLSADDALELAGASLDATKERTRFQAVDLHLGALPETPSAGTLKPVVRAVGDGDAQVRKQALRTLVEIGICHPDIRASVVDALFWGLYDPAGPPTREALHAHGLIAQEWPSFAGQVVRSLTTHIHAVADEQACVAETFTAICTTYPAATDQLAECLVTAEHAHDTAGLAASFYSTLASVAPHLLVGHVPTLIRLARRPDDGATAASSALVTLAENRPALVYPHTDQLRELVAAGAFDPHQWGQIVTALALATPVEAEATEYAEWLLERFPTDVEALAPSLARLARSEPRTVGGAVDTLLLTLDQMAADSRWTLGRYAGNEDHSGDEGSLYLVLEDCLPTLAASHPVFAIPIAGVIRKALGRPESQQAALEGARRLLDSWPHAGPLLEDAIVARLDDCFWDDPDTYVTLIETLGLLGTARAQEALEELTTHPLEDVRVRASRERSATGRPNPNIDGLDATSDSSVDRLDATDASRADIDRLSGLLVRVDDIRPVLEMLEEIALQNPDLRSRVLVQLLLALVTVEGDARRQIHRVLVDITPQTTERRDSIQPVVQTLVADDDELVSAQAAAVVGVLFGTGIGGVGQTFGPEAVGDEVEPEHDTLIEILGTALERESPLVRSRALAGIGSLAPRAPDEVPAVVDRIESRLFAPHHLVPLAAQTASAVGVASPRVAPTLAKSLVGLLDWTPLARYSALLAVRELSSVEPAVAPQVIGPLFEEMVQDGSETCLDVFRAIGALPGDSIASKRARVETLLAQIDDGELDRVGMTFLLDRLVRVADSDVAVLAAAIRRHGELDGLFAGDYATYAIELYERLADHDPAVLDEHAPLDGVARSVLSGPYTPSRVGSSPANTTIYDRLRSDITDHYQFDGLYQFVREDKRATASAILGQVGHVRISRHVADSHTQDGEPLAPFEPEVWAAGFRQSPASEIATEFPAETKPPVLAAFLEEFESLPDARKAETIEVIPTFLTGSEPADLREEAIDTVFACLDGDWPLRVEAARTVVTLTKADHLSSRVAEETLLDLFDDESVPVLEHAASGLATIALETVYDVGALVDRLEEVFATTGTTPAARRTPRGAVLALGELGSGEPAVRESVCALLARGLRDNDRWVRLWSIEALVDIGRKDRDAVSAYSDQVRTLLTDVSPEVRAAAIRCLGHVGTSDHRSAIREHGSDPMPVVADAVVEASLALLSRPDIVAPTVERGDPMYGRDLRNSGYAPDVTIESGLTSAEYNRATTAVTELVEFDDYMLEPSIQVTPAVDESTVYTVVQQSDSDRTNAGTVYAIDATTGDVHWHRDLRGRITAPAVAGGQVYVCSTVCDPFDGAAARVYALEATTGEVAWQFTTDCAVRSSPTVVGQCVFGADTDGTVYSLATASGDRRWTHDTGAEIDTTPVVVDGTVYAASADGIHRLDAYTGTLERLFRQSGDERLSPTASRSAVHAAVESSGETVIEAYPFDGDERRWKATLSSESAAAPSVDDRTVYVPTANGLDLLSTSSGEHVETLDADAAVVTKPVVAGSTVLVGCEDGSLVGLSVETGDRWTVNVETQIGGSPAVVGESIYLGTTGGTLYRLDVPSPER